MTWVVGGLIRDANIVVAILAVDAATLLLWRPVMPNRFKFPSKLIIFLCSTLLLLLPGNVLGQTAPVPVSSPQALNLASQALRALAGGTALADITIQANATYIAGSDEETGA